jgi:hypothetical protein
LWANTVRPWPYVLNKSPLSALRFHNVGLKGSLDLRFSQTRRIPDASEEIAESTGAFGKPAILAFRTTCIPCTTGTTNFGRPARMSREGCSARLAGRKEICKPAVRAVCSD